MLLLLACLGYVTGRLRLLILAGLHCYWQALVVVTGRLMLLLLAGLGCVTGMHK